MSDGGWGTIVVGIAVAVIAFMQWRTAHTKVILDLFDRRMAIYDEVGTAVYSYVDRSGSGYDARRRLWTARSQAIFLFGPEVAREIEAFANEIGEIDRINRRLGSGNPPPDESKLHNRLLELDDQLTKADRRLLATAGPYLRLDQKPIRTPARWFRDRDELRKGFGRLDQ